MRKKYETPELSVHCFNVADMVNVDARSAQYAVIMEGTGMEGLTKIKFNSKLK